jgi:hypothetical protein
MTTDTYDTGYAKSRERFERDTAEHEMTVLHDDGLYRHVRFQKPGTGFYYYDLVTWPGRLVVCGDCEDYMFSRLSDMFEFFAGKRQASGINPSYWSQKLCGDRGRDIARRYSEDVFRARVIEWFEDTSGLSAETGRVRAWEARLEMRCLRARGFSRRWRRRKLRRLEGEMPLRDALALSRALQAEVLDGDWEHDTTHEDGARAALNAFEFPNRDGLRYAAPRGLTIDSWEWDLRDFDGWFLWCCWAIVRGIEQYRAARPVDPAVAA